MIQYKQILLTLVALFAISTGAWAQADVTWTYADIYSDLSTKLQAGQAFVKDGIKVEMKIYPNLSPLVEITADNFNVYGGAGYFEFTAPEGKKFSKILLNGGDCYCQWNVAAQISGAPATWEGTEPAAVVTTDPEQTGYDFMLGSPTTFEFYFASDPIEITPVEGQANKWTFSMPGSDVVLTPQYAPAAQLAENGAPAPVSGLEIAADAAIITAGQSAQGTLLYAVGTSETEKPALTAFAATLPNAKDLTAAGNYYVWYYIQGQDTPQGQEPSADNTFNDSEIMGPVMVELLTNEHTLNIKQSPNITVTVAGTAKTPTDDKVTPVTTGQEVKIKAKEGYKFRKVEVKKGAAEKPVTLATALEDGATIKVNFKWRNKDNGDYVQGVYNAASGTFTVSKGGDKWGTDGRSVYKVEKSGDNIIIGAGSSDYNVEGMVWTFNTTNDTYTTTNGAEVNQFPNEYGLISVSVNDTDITSTLSELK